MILVKVKRVLLAMAVLDVLVFGGWIAREEAARTGARIDLPVRGYDPRDLLSGHYVQFRLVAERETEALEREDATTATTATTGESVSVCLERGEDGLHHVTHFRGPREACTFITGTRAAGRVDFGVDRFYVDERRAGEVGWVAEGPSTYLVASVDPSGAVHAVDLVVSGKSLAPTR